MTTKPQQTTTTTTPTPTTTTTATKQTGFATKDLFKKTAEENAKIKPTKSYLEADVAKSYKETPEEVSKPEFKSGKTDNEPHFVDINKNDDVSHLINHLSSS